MAYDVVNTTSASTFRLRGRDGSSSTLVRYIVSCRLASDTISRRRVHTGVQQQTTKQRVCSLAEQHHHRRRLRRRLRSKEQNRRCDGDFGQSHRCVDSRNTTSATFPSRHTSSFRHPSRYGNTITRVCLSASRRCFNLVFVVDTTTTKVDRKIARDPIAQGWNK